MRKSGEIELSINADKYLSESEAWGAYDPDKAMTAGLREALQNCFDGAEEDAGRRLSDEELRKACDVYRDEKRDGVIVFRNGGAISINAWLIGDSDKSEKKHLALRGTHGDGLKTAAVIFSRLPGCRMKIFSGEGNMEPYIAPSKTFEGKRVLWVTLKPSHSTKHEVKVEIHGVPKSVWDTFAAEMSLVLAGIKKSEFVAVGEDRILTGARFVNKLFVHGLFVCQMPANAAYGYDLTGVKLGRDREMAEPWMLRQRVATLLKDAVLRQALPMEAFTDLMHNSNTYEAEAVRYSYEYASSPDVLSRAVVSALAPKATDETVFVSTAQEFAQASMEALQPVMVSAAIKAMGALALGSFESKRTRRALEVRATWQVSDLNSAERNRLEQATEIMARFAGEPLPTITVVDFFGKIGGTWCGEGTGIRIARSSLDTRKHAIAVLIHELAHRHGKDGTLEHRQASERIAASIIDGLMGTES